MKVIEDKSDDDYDLDKSYDMDRDTPQDGESWGKNSTKTHQNRKFVFLHISTNVVFTTFLLRK